MYSLRTWTKSDSVWEGIVVNDKIKIYRFVCNEDDCPNTVSFGDKPFTTAEVAEWIGVFAQEKWFAFLHDPAVEMQEMKYGFWG